MKYVIICAVSLEIHNHVVKAGGQINDMIFFKISSANVSGAGKIL
jgi:hypothetical protein